MIVLGMNECLKMVVSDRGIWSFCACVRRVREVALVNNESALMDIYVAIDDLVH